MKRFATVAPLLLAATAMAQEPSNLNPPSPQPQPGQRAWYPGQPLPPAAPPSSPAAAPPQPEGPGGLILLDGIEGGDGAGEGVPEQYTVHAGDTLWDLSDRFFGSAWAWPKLWSYNPAITNPHWIYPGDLLQLAPPVVTVAPAATAEGTPHQIIGAPPEARGVFLRQTGFVEPGELATAGKIVGSREEKIMLSTLDEAYVEFPRDKPLVVGQRYTIYQPTREVTHPVTGRTLGQMVEIFGEGEVLAVTSGRIARFAILETINPIERGFRVGPLRRTFKRVAPTVDGRNLQGVVVATLQPRDMIGAGNLVFLDCGKRDGVELGNRFLITRRGDGYQPIRASGPVDDPRFPRETIAEILVVDLRDHLATGLVTRSTKEARIGDRVETRKGF